MGTKDTPTIRREELRDARAIHQLTKAAFAEKAFSDGREADIIDEMRAEGDLILSLVAELEGEVVGHIGFSFVSINRSRGNWVGLGPLAVLPQHQGQGIGHRLVETGLRQIRNAQAAGCVLVGDPNYYQRFGFKCDGAVSYRNLPGKNVQWLSFNGDDPAGEITFCRALES